LRKAFSVIELSIERVLNANMGRNCAIKSCSNSKNGPKDSKVHSFPNPLKSSEVRDGWIQAVFPRGTMSSDIKKYIANTGVCSRHFLPSDYRNGSKENGQLNRSSVPSHELPRGGESSQYIIIIELTIPFHELSKMILMKNTYRLL
jgi:hypothetical protein